MRDRLAALAVVAAVAAAGASAAVAAVVSGDAAAGWSLVSISKPTAPVTSLSGVACFSSAGCLSVGERDLGPRSLPVAERWNGSKWIEQPISGLPSLGGGLNAVSCPAATACAAVGSYVTANARVFATFAERWDGSRWSVERVPDPTGAELDSDDLAAVSCSSVTACTAVGDITNRPGTVGRPLIERWNGTRWTVQPVPSSLQGSLEGVSCPSARACIAVGSLGDPASASGVPLIMRWTGSRWARMNATTPQAGGFGSVACVSNTACTAVGWSLADTQSPLIERLHGSSWAVQSTPVLKTPTVQGSLSGVACTAPTACTAVGAFLNGAGTAGPLIENANGGAWTLQQAAAPRSPLLSSLNAVSCLTGERCLAVGFADNHPLSERHP